MLMKLKQKKNKNYLQYKINYNGIMLVKIGSQFDLSALIFFHITTVV